MFEPADKTELADDDPRAPWNTDPFYRAITPSAQRKIWEAFQRREAENLAAAREEPSDDAPPPAGPYDYGEITEAPPEAIDPAPTRPRRFPLQAFCDVRVDETRRGYLVKGLLASTGLAVVWGPPKCGKSFWAVDIGMHISLGWEYRGRRVQQAPVVYIALEGQYGLPARLEAFKRQHGVTEAPFYLASVRLNLIADVAALVTDIRAQIGDVLPGAVFLDTLNRSLVGSESKDEDMAKYLAAADYLAGQLAAAVIVIHHCGIDASRPRGHTSLTGSVESQLAVKRAESGEVVVTVEFAKDMPEGAEVYSRLDPVTVGTDPDGDEITTLVVLPADAPAGKARKSVKGANKVALDVLRKAIDEAGEGAPANNHIPPGQKVVRIETWRTYSYQGSIAETDKPDSLRRAFARASSKLQSAGLIGVWGDYAWIA
jgi:hypothetical protein